MKKCHKVYQGSKIGKVLSAKIEERHKNIMTFVTSPPDNSDNSITKTS